MPPSTLESAAPGQPEVIVVTGMSGAGRSTAAHALEDLGWFVVDNMPPSLLPRMVELARQPSPAGDATSRLRIAVVTDVRGGEFFGDLRAALDTVEGTGIRPRLVFLEADDETIVQRFESNRRPHPLQGDGRLVDGIAAERRILAQLRETADLLIDTTRLNVHQLRDRVETALGGRHAPAVQVTILSFGFKYGLPVDADFVLDCRFLPNPYWIPELRALNGQDVEVTQFVLEQPGAAPFVEHLVAALGVVLDGYRAEGKRYATIAVGCTGGKHRSVAIAHELERRIASSEVALRVVHRDLGRE